jgi:organic radical activating enzyme
MSVNKYFDRPTITAVELFSAGWCNLDCKYCYIPKTNFLKDIHKTIINKIDSGEMLEDLKHIYGEDLTHISHWGTEPTLTVKRFKKFYKDAIEIFPKLEKVFVSSNFMTNPDNIIKFVTEILPKKKSLNIGIQLSLDGPPWITDKNRRGGSANEIIDNINVFIKEINKIGTVHKILTNVKPTIDNDDMLPLSDFDMLKGYYDFFEECFEKWTGSNNNKTITMGHHVDPTIAVPLDYSQANGKAFCKVIKNEITLAQIKKYKFIAQPLPSYYWRLEKTFKNLKEYYIKFHQFRCSAGGGCFALGHNKLSFQPCHRTFYLDDNRYIKSTKQTDLNEVLVDAARNTPILMENSIVNYDDELSLLKNLYLHRTFRDFAKHSTSLGVAIIFELADLGMIHKKYKDPELATLLSIIPLSVECPIEIRIMSGTYALRDVSLFKLFGNGALEEVVKYYIREKNSGSF